MKRKLTLISIVFLIWVVSFSLTLTLVTNGGQEFTPSTTLSASVRSSPPIPQDPEWDNVLLETEYFYNDTATVSWSGQVGTGSPSPFLSLLNWTENGTITGGIWPGNPGNATLTGYTNAEYSEQDVKDFLNYSMETFVRFNSWPSLSIFNFTEYENASLWVFEDEIASMQEFLNNTLYHVSNASRYLINGFNVTGITSVVPEIRIRLEWSTAESTISFSYRIPDATILQGDTYIFSFARALGRTVPLRLAGTGLFEALGPATRMIINATPVAAYPDVTFPIFPVGIESFDFLDEVERDYDFTIWYQEPTAGLSISRDVSTTILNRGELLDVTVTVNNTGDLLLSRVEVEDLSGITSGFFQLISGNASTRVPTLASGQILVMRYTVMAVQQGPIELEPAIVEATDLFYNEHFQASSTVTLSINPGSLPNEILLVQLTIGLVILVIVLLILYRFRRRIFYRT